MPMTFAFVGLLLMATRAVGQGASRANPDSATFDTDGTAHITRLVPMPSTVSPEAQQWLKEIEHEEPQPKDLAEIRVRTDAWQKSQSAEAKKLFPVNVERTTMAGVQTDIITPLVTPEKNEKRVLINLHGGGFITDSGSLIEGIPITYLTKMKVVSVYYRLAPENPFPAAVDDVVAVYKELLKTYPPRNTGIFGTSAGDADRRGCGEAETIEPATSWRAGHVFYASGFQPSNGFAGTLCAERIFWPQRSEHSAG